MAEHIPELEALFKVAQAFVDKNYVVSDKRDQGIKILATINQLIELKKLNQPEVEWVQADAVSATDTVPRRIKK